MRRAGGRLLYIFISIKKEIEFCLSQNSISSGKVNSCLKEECGLNASLCPLVQSVLHIASTSALWIYQKVTVIMSDLHVWTKQTKWKKVEHCHRNSWKQAAVLFFSFFFFKINTEHDKPPPRFFWHFSFLILNSFWEVKAGVTDRSWTIKPVS